MFVATYWWVFLLIGVVLVGVAFYQQVRRMNDLSGGEAVDRLAARLEGKEDPNGGFFKGFAVTALCMLLGGLSLLLGLIGLVVTLVRG